MTLIQLRPELSIGDIGITTKKIKDKRGYFDKHTEVIITGITDQGYNISDASGHEIQNCGYLSVMPKFIRYS